MIELRLAELVSAWSILVTKCVKAEQSTSSQAQSLAETGRCAYGAVGKTVSGA